MSPEANRPETQTGSPDFVEGLHPTDNIREFGRGDLSDVAPELIERGVPSADVIDPQTLDVPVDKIPLPPTEAPAGVMPSSSDRIIPPAAPSTAVESDEPPKNRRGLWLGVGGAAAAAAATAVLTLGLTGNSDEVKANPDRETTSASPQPIENENEAPNAGETTATDPTEGLEILKSSGTAQEVLGDYANRISEIINARADSGGTESDNADLQYLTNTPMGTYNPALENFQSFVSNMASNVLDARQKAAQQGIDVVNIAVVSTYVESEPTADGGFVIEAVDEYWAVGEDGQSIGDIISNDDPHRYTFSRADVTLPDGSVKNTFVLTGFEAGSADPAQVLN